MLKARIGELKKCLPCKILISHVSNYGPPLAPLTHVAAYKEEEGPLPHLLHRRRRL